VKIIRGILIQSISRQAIEVNVETSLFVESEIRRNLKVDGFRWLQEVRDFAMTEKG
jgi:hypothetical protein